MLIGRDDGAIVATVMVGHDGHRGWVYYVATDPDRRAKGYGRAIMNAAEDWLRAAGIAKLQLMVRRENARRARVLPVDRLRRSSRPLFSPNGSTAASRRRDGERNSMTISDRVRVKNVEVLSDRHYRLNEVEFDYRRGNGEWQTQKREVFDRGHCRDAVAVQCRKPHAWC